MKKLLLVGMLIVSGLSFGRDYEVRERQELKAVEEVHYEDQAKLSRERSLGEKNMEVYSDFHAELDRMDRGTDKK